MPGSTMLVPIDLVSRSGFFDLLTERSTWPIATTKALLDAQGNTTKVQFCKELEAKIDRKCQEALFFGFNGTFLGL